MQTVIITGARGNLGSAVTSTFLDKGYRVIATVVNDADKKDLPQHQNLQVVAVNLTNEAETSSFVQNVLNTHQQVHAAILLVGGFAAGNLATTSGEDIKKQIALNFETAYYVARPVLQHMLEQNTGRIIFVGSRPALQASDGKKMVAYGLSKSLLFKLAEYINAEAKGKNVTATVIVPSTLDTPQNRQAMPDADPKKWVNTGNLAEIIEFVVSEKSTPIREGVIKVYNNA